MYLDCARQCSRRCAKVGHAVACARNAAQIARRNRELLIFVFTGRGGTLIILILSQTLVSSLYKEDLFADLLKVSEQQKFLQSFFFVSSHLFHPSSSSTSSSLLSSSSVVCNAGERRSDCSASSGEEAARRRCSSQCRLAAQRTARLGNAILNFGARSNQNSLFFVHVCLCVIIAKNTSMLI